MDTEKTGSFIREPAISEEALKQRIEYLIGTVPLNEHTVVERTLHFDELGNNLDFVRSKKELEASLNHQIDTQATVTLRYNPSWRVFDARKLTFALPGTSSLTANLTLDTDAGEYASSLYDDQTEQEIARKPVQPSTVGTLLTTAGLSPEVVASTQSELLAELFQTARHDDELTIKQSAVLMESEMTELLSSACYVERTQTYSADEITDIIHFVTEINSADSSHARVISVINSQHGSTITGEERSINHATGESTARGMTFDYDTIEKMLSHVNRVIAATENH